MDNDADTYKTEPSTEEHSEEVVQLERMSYGPQAVGHLASGKTVFVEGAFPHDVAQIEVYEDKPHFARARVVRIIEPSDLRVSDPVCTCVDMCGGCAWARLDYDAQCEEKRTIVVDALIHTAHIPQSRAEELVQSCVPSKRQWGYRNKLELSASHGKRGLFEIGFCRQGTHEIVTPDVCPIAHNLIERSPKALYGALRFLQGSQDLGVYRVGVRASIRTKSVEVALWTPPDAFPRMTLARPVQVSIGATSVVRVLAEPDEARVVKKVEMLEGRGCWEEKFHDENFWVSAPSFFQVNTAQAEKLVDMVIEELGVEEGMRVADLYAGVGTFSIPLARAGACVVAVEVAGFSARDLRRNADSAGVEVEVICDDVERALPELEDLDVMVVDPPKSGLTQKIIDAIADLPVHSLAYVSCDPQTWARDVAYLEECGFRLRCATPVDMFPQTYHIEVASFFERED